MLQSDQKQTLICNLTFFNYCTRPGFKSQADVIVTLGAFNSTSALETTLIKHIKNSIKMRFATFLLAFSNEIPVLMTYI